MQRCAMPSPPHTKKWSAPLRRSLRTCFGAFLLFGTSTQSGSETPCRASARRSSGRPPSMLLPEWAMTAIELIATARPWCWQLRRRGPP